MKNSELTESRLHRNSPGVGGTIDSVSESQEDFTF